MGGEASPELRVRFVIWSHRSLPTKTLLHTARQRLYPRLSVLLPTSTLRRRLAPPHSRRRDASPRARAPPRPRFSPPLPPFPPLRPPFTNREASYSRSSRLGSPRDRPRPRHQRPADRANEGEEAQARPVFGAPEQRRHGGRHQRSTAVGAGEAAEGWVDGFGRGGLAEDESARVARHGGRRRRGQGRPSCEVGPLSLFACCFTSSDYFLASRLLPKLSPDSAVGTLKAIGLLGCARDGTLTFSPPLHDPNLPNDPSCSVCDIWSGSAAFDHDEATGDHPRAFANKPLKELREAAKTVLDPAVGDPLRLEFVKTLARTLRHSKNTMAAIGFGGVADRLMESVWAEMEAATRGLRLAAGYVPFFHIVQRGAVLIGLFLIRNVILAIVQAHQEKDASTAFVADLCGCLDSCLTHQRPAVIETTLVTLGRIARCVLHVPARDRRRC